MTKVTLKIFIQKFPDLAIHNIFLNIFNFLFLIFLSRIFFLFLNYIYHFSIFKFRIKANFEILKNDRVQIRIDMVQKEISF